MKKLILALFITAGLASCTDYGKKIKIDGTNSELFYKDGVTEAEAKSTGDFLKKEFIRTDKAASMQVTKEGDVYTIRIVYDKKYYTDSLKDADDQFKILGAKASKDVFSGKKVTIALADESFKDFKVLPYDETIAKALNAPPVTPESLGYTGHHTEGDVKFFWKDISDEESKTIGEYIIKNGAFAGGHAEIYMTKENGRYIIRFPVIASARNDASYLSEVDKTSKDIKDNVFADQPYTFIVTDENLATVKTWDY